MDGMEILSFTLKAVPQMVEEVLGKEKLTMEDIDMFIFHQPGGFVLEKLRRKMKIQEEKFFIDIQKKGNTVSATIPLGIYDAMQEGKIKKGDRILIAGFGIGLTWGATVITL
jgi:3-oxoacyl-[acyl-carrier-protein] synthase-3